MLQRLGKPAKGCWKDYFITEVINRNKSWSLNSFWRAWFVHKSSRLIKCPAYLIKLFLNALRNTSKKLWVSGLYSQLILHLFSRMQNASGLDWESSRLTLTQNNDTIKTQKQRHSWYLVSKHNKTRATPWSSVSENKPHGYDFVILI